MNKAQRIISIADAAEAQKYQLRFCHHIDTLRPVADIRVSVETPHIRLIGGALDRQWSPEDLDDLAAWAHKMLDDEGDGNEQS